MKTKNMLLGIVGILILVLLVLALSGCEPTTTTVVEVVEVAQPETDWESGAGECSIVDAVPGYVNVDFVQCQMSNGDVCYLWTLGNNNNLVCLR